ncbi:hypothetical protein ACX80U_11655 [Arthrobacter sp. TmT3-37]
MVGEGLSLSLLGWTAADSAAEIMLAEKVLVDAHRVQVKSLTA